VLKKKAAQIFLLAKKTVKARGRISFAFPRGNGFLFFTESLGRF